MPVPVAQRQFAALIFDTPSIIRDAEAGPLIILPSGGTSSALSNVWFVDIGTNTAPADQTGAIGAPFSTLTAALAAGAALSNLTLICTPGDYSSEAPLLLNKAGQQCVIMPFLPLTIPAFASGLALPTALFLPDITAVGLAAFILQGASLATLSTDCPVYLTGCAVQTTIASSNTVNLTACSPINGSPESGPGGVISSFLEATNSFLNGNIQGDNGMRLVGCDVNGSFTTLGGVFQLDAFTLGQFRSSGTTRSGGPTGCVDLPSAVVTVSIPAMLANAQAEVVINFATTLLVGLLVVGDALAVGPATGLPANVGIASVVATSTGTATIRFISIGVVAPTDVDLTFIRVPLST